MPRGLITAADEHRARVSVQRGGENPRFERRYPGGGLFSHAVGYSFSRSAAAGSSSSTTTTSPGEGDELQNLFGDIVEQEEGDGLVTTLDPRGQRPRSTRSAGSAGAVVAIEPSTGGAVMASVPSSTPTRSPTSSTSSSRPRGRPLVNRATQARYPPGSTFKVVTAAAALESGEYTPESILDGSARRSSAARRFRTPRARAAARSLTDGADVLGQHGLRAAGSSSARGPVRAHGALRLLPRPSARLPVEQMFASGVYEGEELVDGPGRHRPRRHRPGAPAGDAASDGDGRRGVANDGALMARGSATRSSRPDGRVKDRLGPARASQVMSPENADALAEMMQRVVDEGTGTNAQIAASRWRARPAPRGRRAGPRTRPGSSGSRRSRSPRSRSPPRSRGPRASGGDVAAPIAAT